MIINNFLVEGNVSISIGSKDFTVPYKKFKDKVLELQDFADHDRQTQIERRRTTFTVFYNSYGKKIKKDPAWKKWLKLKDADISLIFKTLPSFLSANPDVKYRPAPDVYLNQRRWEDEIGEVKERVKPEYAEENKWG